MNKSINETTASSVDKHRFWFYVRTTDQWYAIIRECRSWFGKNWRAQSKVKRKLESQFTVSKVTFTRSAPLPVWFEVPDPRFATWISVKLSLQVESDAKHQGGK